MNRLRAIFFGTPEIAVPALEALTEIAEIVAVVCQPDRPSGRGLALQPPRVKHRAVELGLRVLQPAKMRDGLLAADVEALACDFALVIAYGRILPRDVLQSPRLGCFNLHASILPRYRGAAPITWAIVRGETETGISVMQMDEGMDTGPVLADRRLHIGETETAGELTLRLAALAAETVRLDVPRVLAGGLTPTPQVAELATYAPLLQKADGVIRWDRPACDVHNHVRGMAPWPGAFTSIEGRALKVLASRVSEFSSEGTAPGTVICADPHRVLVACVDGPIELVRGQMEGRKALSGGELVSGRTLRAGMRLGS